MLSNALISETNCDPVSRTSLIELTVGVQLASPWAYCRNGVFGGIEVEDVVRFAKWLGRPVRFVVLAPWETAQALANADVDLVIGGVQADNALRKVALSCTYSSTGSRADEQSPSHVWATPRGSSALFATLAFYLWMVRKQAPRLRAATLH